jgi:hypothetical protein
MSRRFGNDRSHQDKARNYYLALHGPQARRENAKERDEARAKRTDLDQLEVIAFRKKQGVDKGSSAREITRLHARIEAAAIAKSKPAESNDRKPNKQKVSKQPKR